MFLACIIVKRSGAKTRIKSNAPKNRTKLTELSTKLRRDQPYRHRFIFLCYSVNTVSSNCEEKRLFRIDNFPFSIFSHLPRLKNTRWSIFRVCVLRFLTCVYAESWSARRTFWRRFFFYKTVSKSIISIYGVLFFGFVFICLPGCFICLCLLPALAQILDYLQ